MSKTEFLVIVRGEKGDPGVGSGDPALINTHNASPSSHADLRAAIALKVEPYVHIQSQMAVDWIVNHGLGRPVSVSVYDSQGREGSGAVVANGNMSLVISVARPMSGYANII